MFKKLRRSIAFILCSIILVGSSMTALAYDQPQNDYNTFMESLENYTIANANTRNIPSSQQLLVKTSNGENLVLAVSGQTYSRYVKWTSNGYVVSYSLDTSNKSTYVGTNQANNSTVVKFLQGCLNKAGFTDDYGRKLVVDGNFGANTKAAIIKLQNYEDSVIAPITADGICGPVAWGKLLSWCLPSNYITISNPILCY